GVSPGGGEAGHADGFARADVLVVEVGGGLREGENITGHTVIAQNGRGGGDGVIGLVGGGGRNGQSAGRDVSRGGGGATGQQIVARIRPGQSQSGGGDNLACGCGFVGEAGGAPDQADVIGPRDPVQRAGQKRDGG